jgi:hypothetical protein
MIPMTLISSSWFGLGAGGWYPIRPQAGKHVSPLSSKRTEFSGLPEGHDDTYNGHIH